MGDFTFSAGAVGLSSRTGNRSLDGYNEKDLQRENSHDLPNQCQDLSGDNSMWSSEQEPAVT